MQRIFLYLPRLCGLIGGYGKHWLLDNEFPYQSTFITTRIRLSMEVIMFSLDSLTKFVLCSWVCVGPFLLQRHFLRKRYFVVSLCVWSQVGMH
jgi:hypothetical protein